MEKCLAFVLGGSGARGTDVGGVAFWAHIGRFVAGMVMVKLMPTGERRERALTW